MGIGFDKSRLSEALPQNAPVVRVSITSAAGSTPRGAGTAMLVWKAGQDGTIGGGRLEWDACIFARKMLADNKPAETQSIALGPALGQCCGGRVELHFEQVSVVDFQAENSPETTQPVFLYGAGHVGRELVRVLQGLPFAVTWIDINDSRFPPLKTGLKRRINPNPAAVVPEAPDTAYHFVMTHSHSHDLEICNQVLHRGFGHLGLIGSATKKARFLKRLRELGHSETTLARLQCPIGDRRLGKTPQAIAIGVAYWLMQRNTELNEPQGEGQREGRR